MPVISDKSDDQKNLRWVCLKDLDWTENINQGWAIPLKFI